MQVGKQPAGGFGQADQASFAAAQQQQGYSNQGQPSELYGSQQNNYSTFGGQQGQAAGPKAQGYIDAAAGYAAQPAKAAAATQYDAQSYAAAPQTSAAYGQGSYQVGILHQELS